MYLGQNRLNHLLSVVLLLRAHDDFGPDLGIFDCKIVLKINILDSIGQFWIELGRHSWNEGTGMEGDVRAAPMVILEMRPICQLR